MIEHSKQHLIDSKTTYTDHLKFALYASGLLFIAAFASLIHAFIPALFKGTAASIVLKLYTIRLKNHPNPLYQSMKNDNP